METRPLVIEDVNNKLQCFGFNVIHFAPAPGSVKTEDFNRLYIIKREEKHILVKLVTFCRVPFGQIGSIITVPATGFESHVWCRLWLQKYPRTTDETEMAVYSYIQQR